VSVCQVVRRRRMTADIDLFLLGRHCCGN
jgi:hypothetical protein